MKSADNSFDKHRAAGTGSSGFDNAESRLAVLCPADEQTGGLMSETLSLADIFRDIRKGRNFGEAPVAAAFAAPLAQSTHLPISETLGGWIAIAILHRPLAQDVESLVKDACVAFRLLKRSDTSLLSAFDLRDAKSLAGAHAMLSAQEQDGASHVLLLRLRPVRALLDAAARDRAVIERNVTESRTGVRVAPAGSMPRDLDGLIDREDRGDSPDPLDEPEATALADAPVARRHLTRQERSYDDKVRDRERTRIAAMSAAMRDLALPASVDLLTDHEARTVLAAARSCPQDPALTALALSLIYGRSVERLRTAFEAVPVGLQSDSDTTTNREAWCEGSGGALALEIAVALPKFAVELPKPLGAKITSDGRERLRLGVPAPLRAELLLGFDPRNCEACQRRLESPQKCRSKSPQFPGPVISRFQ